MGDDYFQYGSLVSLNNDLTSLTISVPAPSIVANFIYGLQSFSIVNQSSISFTATSVSAAGTVAFTPTSPFVYKRIQFDYMHHKKRTCPTGFLYFNISETLCYDQCGPYRYFGQDSTMTCEKCVIGCLTCTNKLNCTTCLSTDFRSLQEISVNVSGVVSTYMRCTANNGYYDNGVNNPATPCITPCLTCSSSTACTTCIIGYYLSSTSCLPCSSAINYCNTCSSNILCTQCQYGTGSLCDISCTISQYFKFTINAC